MTLKKELANRPDFEIYSKGMNATIKLKWKDIGKFIVPGKIIDVGCGTGELTKIIAQEFPDSYVIGLDISDHFVHLSQINTMDFNNVEIQKRNAIGEEFEPDSITTKLFSSIMHELASYNGHNKENPKKAIRQSYQELKRGGRIIIRDGISPGYYEVYMWFNDKNGINELDPKKNKVIDFKKLSTEARFIRFCMQFKGRKWDYEIVEINNKKFYKMDAHFANEFMSKKEYIENWDIEILEEFGIFTCEEYKSILELEGFEVIELKVYENPWIVQNWYKSKLEIYKYEQDEFKKIDYFPTNIIIVGEKPKKH